MEAFACHLTVYSASKAGLHLFTDSLRVLLAGTSVRVFEATMRLVDTPMTQGRGRGKLAAAEAARRLIEALRDGRRDQVWIGQAAAAHVLLRVAPSLMRRMMQRA